MMQKAKQGSFVYFVVVVVVFYLELDVVVVGTGVDLLHLGKIFRALSYLVQAGKVKVEVRDLT